MPSRLRVVLVSLLLASPAVVFWLWLVIVPARVAILCPEKCKCDTGGYNVECNYLPANPVPLLHFTNVQLLSLYFNEIKFFEKDIFNSLTELEVLSVNRCGLREIEVGAFNGLAKLTELYIQHNEISEIIPGTSEGMSSLEKIDLSSNNIEHLNSDVFSGLVNLKTIHLWTNKLQYLHPNIFLRLPNLQQLYLTSNPILQIPTDRNFIQSHSLSFLSISYCNVSSLSVETFANVSALERLDLTYNNLKTIDINILKALPELSELFLEGNPLQCDCQLQEVWRWCKDRNIETGYNIWTRVWNEKPNCHTPIEVEGMWWGVLENGQCLEGNIQYYGDYKNTTYRYRDIVKHEYKKEYDIYFLVEYQLPIYAVPFIFGTVSNIILLIIIICNKDMRTVPNMYIVNLAISDIIYLTVLFSEACVKKIVLTWLFSKFMCNFFSFCRRLSVGLSAYSIALYSIQRYRVIVNPFHVRLSSPPTRRGIVATFFAVWIVAALFAVPSTLSKNLCPKSSDFLYQIHFVRLITYYQRVVIFELLVSCLLPLCAIAFSYIMTARHLVESSHPITEGTQNPQMKTRRNTAKIVVGLTVVFLISYVPYHIFWTYYIHGLGYISSFSITFYLQYSNYKFQYTYLISNCFLLINPCLNPVALFCTSSPFRQHLKRYLTCFCKTNSPPTDLELARRN